MAQGLVNRYVSYKHKFLTKILGKLFSSPCMQSCSLFVYWSLDIITWYAYIYANFSIYSYTLMFVALSIKNLTFLEVLYVYIGDWIGKEVGKAGNTDQKQWRQNGDMEPLIWLVKMIMSYFSFFFQVFSSFSRDSRIWENYNGTVLVNCTYSSNIKFWLYCLSVCLS